MTTSRGGNQREPAMRSRLYTVEEVAQSLRGRPRMVREMAARGEIGYHRVGKRLLFPEAEVARLLSATYQPPRGSGVR